MLQSEYEGNPIRFNLLSSEPVEQFSFKPKNI